MYSVIRAAFPIFAWPQQTTLYDCRRSEFPIAPAPPHAGPRAQRHLGFLRSKGPRFLVRSKNPSTWLGSTLAFPVSRNSRVNLVNDKERAKLQEASLQQDGSFRAAVFSHELVGKLYLSRFKPVRHPYLGWDFQGLTKAFG